MKVMETLVLFEERGSWIGLLNWSRGHEKRSTPVLPATSSFCAVRTAVQLSLPDAGPGEELMRTCGQCGTRTSALKRASDWCQPNG